MIKVVAEDRGARRSLPSDGRIMVSNVGDGRVVPGIACGGRPAHAAPRTMLDSEFTTPTSASSTRTGARSTSAGVSARSAWRWLVALPSREEEPRVVWPSRRAQRFADREAQMDVLWWREVEHMHTALAMVLGTRWGAGGSMVCRCGGERDRFSLKVGAEDATINRM